MKHVFRSLLLLALVLLCTSASAEFFGTAPTLHEHYNAGMQAYYEQDYPAAAEYFLAAGNLQDAKQWAYYCQAIDSVVNGSGKEKEILHAKARFELLAHQSFQQANQWVIYCTGRAYELKGLGRKAADECYNKVLIHDSIERYMSCIGKSKLLESEEPVKKRMSTPLRAKFAYEEGMLNYLYGMPEDYKKAADYFCLAGNYEDALQWRCFCLAISLVVNDDNVEDASWIFSMLSQQGFEEAEQWLSYCTARDYEKKGLKPKATDLYKTVFVHDSSERYLRLLGVE